MLIDFFVLVNGRTAPSTFGSKDPPPPFPPVLGSGELFVFRIPLPKKALNGPIFIKWTHLGCISVTIRGEKKP